MKEVRSASPGKYVAANCLIQYYGGKQNGGSEFDFAPYPDQYDCEIFKGTFLWEHDLSHYDANRAQGSLAAGLKLWDYNFKPNYDFPEVHGSLRTPAGPAQESGYVWTREFTEATVRLDVENPTTASITPK